MKYNREHKEPDTWQPLADIFSGLMLMFLLILMLIILFIGYKDETYGNDYSNVGDHGDGGYLVHVSEDDFGDGEHDEVSEVSEVEGGGGSEYGLAAVKVIAVDADTGKVIKEAGITFSLHYGFNNNLVSLNTYYPEKISYSKFETVDDGTLFLPEKVHENTYVLKNLSAPAGYIAGDSFAFTVAEAHHWDDPYVVYFPLSAQKHSFAIRVTDKDTGKPVPMGVYDITTESGEHVATITCDANGYGQSEILPQNTKYVITQSKVNEFYAALEHPITVSLDGTPGMVIDIQATKTTFEVCVVDELYKTPISGATFAIYNEDGALLGEYITNEKGLVRLQNLHKNASYTVKQIKWADKWQETAYETNFVVDEYGRINGYGVYSLTEANRMIRINITARDLLLGIRIDGSELSLRDESGNIVYSWTSEKHGTDIEGIAPGRYTVERNGSSSFEIFIEDTAEIQEFQYKLFNIWILLAIIFCWLVIIIGVIAIIISRRKKKKGDEEEALREEDKHDE